jgi:hypothetical protein
MRTLLMRKYIALPGLCSFLTPLLNVINEETTGIICRNPADIFILLGFVYKTSVINQIRNI